jgi:hypothetical protein
MATKKRRRFAEGGISEAADKESGLKASQGEKVGFFERLRMGNIDDEGSEAYRRFGAGRGKADRTPVETMEPSFVRQSAAPAAMSDVDELEAADIRYRENPIVVPAGPKVAKRASTQAAKPSAPVKSAPKMQEQTYRRTSGDSGERSSPDTSNYSNDGRGKVAPKPLVEQIPRDKSTVVGGERVSGSELGRNIANTALALGPGKLAGLGSIGVEMRGAKGAQEAYNKAATARRTAEMRAKGDATKFASKPAQKSAPKTTKKFDDQESSIEFKRGGKVKKAATPMKKMASGGMTSKASSRGDGIAQRGKTRGRIY